MAVLAVDKELEKLALELIKQYRAAAAFEEALQLFEDSYVEEHRDSIANVTRDRPGGPITDFDQAKELMEVTKFIDNKTKYKKIGLMLGVDPEYFKDFRIDDAKLPPTAADRVKEFFNRKQYNITYDAAPGLPGGFPSRLDYGATAGLQVQKKAIFLQYALVQYFVDKGSYLNKGAAGAGDAHIGLARGLLTTLDSMVQNTQGSLPSSSSGVSLLRSQLSRNRTQVQAKTVAVTNLNANSSIEEIKKSVIGGRQEDVYYFNVGNGSSDGAALKSFLDPIVAGQSPSFNQLDSLLDQIWRERGKDLNSLFNATTDRQRNDVIRNQQLQDILAFFGDATSRDSESDSEVSTRSIESARQSVRDFETSPPKLTPFDFQCFLLENISKLVDNREADGLYARDYENIIAVSTNGDPGNIINTIEHGSRAGVVESFLNICPDVYGLLVPYLKISRLEYDKLGNILVDPKTKRAVVRDLEIPNFISKDDISSILSGGTGRAPGAGIKSFTWSLDGVQPAEVDNNISATLVMYFQSVNDFFNGARSAGQAAPNFLDLIINSPAVKKLQNKKSGNKAPEEKPCSDDLLRTQIHKDYEGKNYRVKICAGWATPDYNTILELVRDDKKALSLIRAINDSRVSLFLQMTQHQINFNQNGSLELTVKYQASLAGLLSGKTANIFDESSGSIDEDIKREKDKIEDIEEREDRRSLSASDKEKKKKALEEIKELKNIQRNVKYRKLLRKIYSSKKVYNISLNPSELTLTPYKDLDLAERLARIKRKADPELPATFEFAAVPKINQEMLDALNKNMAAKGSATSEAYSNIATKTFDQLTDQSTINIPFFYLGDLFDTVLEEIKENNKKNAADGVKPLNFNFFMSDVEMIDPLRAFRVENLEELINCGYDLRDVIFLDAATKETPTHYPEVNGVYRTMNIGDIPISLDAFQLWFKNNVVKKNKNNYFFLYFVKDVCKELITNALSSKCFGKEFNFQQRFDAQPLTLAKQEAKISNFSPKKSTTSEAIAKAKASVSCNLDPTQTELGLLLYPTDSNPKNLRGLFQPDLRRGIYHHYLGSSCGLVKQINFQREDQPYLRESRIQKEGALGAEQLRELYSANIELVGNTLYKNGMYIYINPSLLGADRTYLDYLGLHGYYMVTKVESTVTPSNFNVSIRALHEGIEFAGNKLQPSRQVFALPLEGVDPEVEPHQWGPRDPPETPVPTAPAPTVDDLVTTQDVVVAPGAGTGGMGRSTIRRGASEDRTGGITAGSNVSSTGQTRRN
tara:strand:- start:6310 stop:10104 length:3795 start_codon:yes stop_codon:yes gene_type:complete